MTDGLEPGIGGKGMLQFPCSLTPAATELLRYCLEISADLGRCCTNRQAEAVVPYPPLLAHRIGQRTIHV